MSADLQVDTDALRSAANRLRDAAAGYRMHHPDELPPMPDGALGSSPIGRETQSRVQQRTAQAFELADGLARAADELAARLLAAATILDEVELLERIGS
jgi:hypothetical protein